MKTFKQAVLIALNESLNERYFTVSDALDAYKRAHGDRNPDEVMREIVAAQNSIEDTVHNDSPTSPLNVLPEPSQEEKIANDYDKADICINGINIKIENPSGSIRTSKDGNSTAFSAHYGYFEDTKGADGDGIDCFVANGTPLDYNGKVYIIDQTNPDDYKFDEHKVVIGVNSKEEAETLYLSNYEPKWDGLAANTEVSMDSLKSWLRNRVNTKPFNTTVDK